MSKQTLTEFMVKEAYEKYTSVPLDRSTKESKFILNNNYIVREPVFRHMDPQEFAHMLGFSGKFMKYWFGFKLKGQ